LVWCTQPDGSHEFLNKRWHDYTGLSPEESRLQGWQPSVHPEDLSRVVSKGRELLASGEPGEVEARLRRYDGLFRWFPGVAEPLRALTASVELPPACMAARGPMTGVNTDYWSRTDGWHVREANTRINTNTWPKRAIVNVYAGKCVAERVGFEFSLQQQRKNLTEHGQQS
jgi:hypothetical protein